MHRQVRQAGLWAYRLGGAEESAMFGSKSSIAAVIVVMLGAVAPQAQA
jgi:hypothetical protein